MVVIATKRMLRLMSPPVKSPNKMPQWKKLRLRKLKRPRLRNLRLRLHRLLQKRLLLLKMKLHQLIWYVATF